MREAKVTKYAGRKRHATITSTIGTNHHRHKPPQAQTTTGTNLQFVHNQTYMDMEATHIPSVFSV